MNFSNFWSGYRLRIILLAPWSGLPIEMQTVFAAVFELGN
jgi:hypothetical protein